MYSHSFQVTELKLHRYFNNYLGQVVEGVTILRYPLILKNERLINKKNVNSTCICTVYKIQSWIFNRYVNDSPEQVVEGLTIHMHTVELSLKDL